MGILVYVPWLTGSGGQETFLRFPSSRLGTTVSSHVSKPRATSSRRWAVPSHAREGPMWAVGDFTEDSARLSQSMLGFQRCRCVLEPVHVIRSPFLLVRPS